MMHPIQRRRDLTRGASLRRGLRSSKLSSDVNLEGRESGVRGGYSRIMAFVSAKTWNKIITLGFAIWGLASCALSPHVAVCCHAADLLVS